MSPGLAIGGIPGRGAPARIETVRRRCWRIAGALGDGVAVATGSGRSVWWRVVGLSSPHATAVTTMAVPRLAQVMPSRCQRVTRLVAAWVTILRTLELAPVQPRHA